MGERGPLKLPTHLRAVNDPKAAGSAAEATPRHAPKKHPAVEQDPQLSAMWDEIVPTLDSAGLLSEADGLVVEMMLRHVIVARYAAKVVDDETVVVKDAAIAGGIKKHPAEQVLRSESEMFLRYAQQLGMTFVARARSPMSKAGDGDENNPFAAPSVG